MKTGMRKENTIIRRGIEDLSSIENTTREIERNITHQCDGVKLYFVLRTYDTVRSPNDRSFVQVCTFA